MEAVTEGGNGREDKEDDREVLDLPLEPRNVCGAPVVTCEKSISGGLSFEKQLCR